MPGPSDAAAQPRREFAALLLAGAAGAALVLLATRQDVARVVVEAPRPLPATVTAVTAQEVVPAASALAVAALASLAAVLATRRVLRRITGLVAAGLGIVIGVLAASPTSTADVLAARHESAAPAGGADAGAAPGSVTSGSAGHANGSLSGFAAHVLLGGDAWRALMIGGALLVVVAALVIVLRATRLPVMSSRYDRPASLPQAPVAAHAKASGTSLWESLSAGADPTAWPGDDEP